MIKRIIATLYKSGYDEFEIRFEHADELQRIQEVIGETCIGFEIIKQSKHMVLAKKITDVLHDEFDNVFRRMFLTLISIAQDSYEAAKNQDIDEFKNIILRDGSVNKFSDFCRRALSKKGFVNFKKTAVIYFMAEEIEKISDIYKYLCKHLVQDSIKLSSTILNLFKEVNGFLQQFYELYYKFDLKKLSAFGKKRKALLAQIDEVYKKIDQKEIQILFYLNTIVLLVFDTNGPLTAMSL